MIDINTKEELKEVIGLDEISICQFSMCWCGSCRSVKAQIESKEQDYPKLKFYYVDLDKVDVADEYEINELPALIAFKKGKVVSKKEQAELFDWLNFLSQTWV